MELDKRNTKQKSLLAGFYHNYNASYEITYMYMVPNTANALIQSYYNNIN